MNRQNRIASLGTLIATGIAAALIMALSDGAGDETRWTFAAAIGLAFAIQWIAFIPAWLKKTEHFYDLVGGSSFVAVAAFCLWQSDFIDLRSGILFAMILAWGGRLSIFLFRRVKKAGSDARFDQIKTSFPRFLFAWTAQALWVSFTLAPVMVAILQPTGKADAFLLIGTAIWLFGYGFEVTADLQKTRFKKYPENDGKFINEGLWSRSRHPNYFGEIVLWVGIAMIAIPTLSGWQWISLTSPLFIFALLRFISGVPMLEKRADEKWGDSQEYQDYKQNTPMLLPRLF